MKIHFLFIALNLFSVGSLAMVPMEKHLISVSQGMSAFYMYSLSEGDERYLKQFKKYQRAAEAAMWEMTRQDRSMFLNSWNNMKSKLNYEKENGEGLYFPGTSRIEYRQYLTNFYLHFQKSENISASQAIGAIHRIQVLSTLLAARVLDVVSSGYGSTTLTEHDNKLNPIAMAAIINSDIHYLLAEKNSEIPQRVMRKIDGKFQFIKHTLIDSKSQTAFFLIYRNMVSMNKILNNY